MNDKFVSNGEYERNLSSCALCMHKKLGVAQCKAFPKKIPDIFLNGENKHFTSYPGDKGILFEPIKDQKKTIA